MGNRFKMLLDLPQTWGGITWKTSTLRENDVLMKIGFWVLHFNTKLGKKIRGTYPYLPPEFKCSPGPEERFISFNANWHWKDNTFTLCESKLAYLFPLYIHISNYFLNILHVFPLFSHDFPMMIIPWFSIYAIDYSVETFIEIVWDFP